MIFGAIAPMIFIAFNAATLAVLVAIIYEWHASKEFPWSFLKAFAFFFLLFITSVEVFG
jgi:hypothetical protein